MEFQFRRIAFMAFGNISYYALPGCLNANLAKIISRDQQAIPTYALR